MSSDNVTNQPEWTVSELSAALKRTVETTYDHVRVRGELGRVTVARSGHLYADIKDDKAVLNTIMWKGQAASLPFRPEEGLEVIATGRLSTYPGRSAYQLIASEMRPAGIGALMALLEDRKKKLAAEGLFDPSHKKALPYLPKTIGVVTSPTGAVFRDILHRIEERFPVRVILWPVLVQGDRAAEQITAAIRGFNAIAEHDRPDVLIVGRGGGSIEDLWPFNEENVVRATFESVIPVISAVGHETDTTLIDYVSDRRAPTPTGAAEFAVPVRSDLALTLQDVGQRQKRALLRLVRIRGERFGSARLPRPERMLDAKRQSLDFLANRLDNSLARTASLKRLALAQKAGALRPELLRADLRRARQRLQETAGRVRPALQRLLRVRRDRLTPLGTLLDSLSYAATLARGYALVRSADGGIVRSSRDARDLSIWSVRFHDGEVDAAPIERNTPPVKTPARKPAPTPSKPDDQGRLF